MTIGIIGAFNEEIELFIEIFNLEKDSNKREIYTGIYNNKKLVVANSGIGKVNSGATTQYIIDKYNVDLIINSGCAGSLLENVKIMDVIISSYVMYHDFYPERVMRYSTPNNGEILANKDLIEKAKTVLSKNNINYYVAPITSGDCFVTDSKMRDDIYEKTKAYAVDMESTSIGHISTINNVPFLSLRTISDFANGEDDFEVKAAHKSSNIVKEIIELL